MAGSGELLEVMVDLAEASGSKIELRERLAELELAIEDQGWTRLTMFADREFSRLGMTRAIKIARLMYLSNPLIRNAVNVQANYVWGQGINIRARDDAINSVVQAFLDDRANRREFSSHTARLLKEVQQQLSGNQFLALFTNPSTGRVKIRGIDVNEVQDIYSNPEDSNEPWFYLRSWNSVEWDESTASWKPGALQRTFYPDWLHPKLRNPGGRQTEIGQIKIQWDAPVYHIKTGGFETMRFGVPEIFPALDWARAVKQDLEDYATIRKALTRFAWRLTRKGGKAAVGAAAKKLRSAVAAGDDQETNPPAATGSTFVQGEGVDMQPIKTSGMAPAPDEGRRLWLMVAAGTGIPETMLSGDATLGSYATAKSLDRPTELEMRNRQELWKGVLSDILNYVVDSAALAVSGPLKGRLVTDKYTGEQRVIVGPAKSPTDRRLDIDFPGILEREVLSRIQAIVTASTLNGQAPAGTLRPETISRMVLSELGEDEVDEELAKMNFPPDGSTPGRPVTSERYRADLQRIADLIEQTGKVSKEGIAQLRADFERMATG